MSTKRHKPRSLDRDPSRDHNVVQNSRSRSEPQRSVRSSYPPTETYTTAVEPSTNRRIFSRGICGLPDFYSKLLGPTAEETLLVGFKTFLKIGLACNSDSELGDYTMSTSIISEGSGIFTESEQDNLGPNDENSPKQIDISTGASTSDRHKTELDYDETLINKRRKPSKQSNDFENDQEETIISHPTKYIKEELDPTSVEQKEAPQTSEKKSDSKNGSQLSQTFDQINDKLDEKVSKIEDSTEKEDEKTSTKIISTDSVPMSSFHSTSSNPQQPSAEVSITISIEKPESKTKKSSIISKEEAKDVKLEEIKEEADENVKEDKGIKQEPVDETSDRKSKLSSIKSSEYKPTEPKEKEEIQSIKSATSDLSHKRSKSASIEHETNDRKSDASKEKEEIQSMKSATSDLSHKRSKSASMELETSERMSSQRKKPRETQSMKSATSNLSYKKSKSVSIELYEVQPATPEEVSVGQSKKEVTEEPGQDRATASKDLVKQELSELVSKPTNDIPSKVSTKYILEPSPGKISSQSNNISKSALTDALKKLCSCHSQQVNNRCAQIYPECRPQNVKQSLKIQHIKSRTFPPSLSSLKVEVSKKSTVCSQKSIKSQNVSKMSHELTPNIPEEDEAQEEISETYDQSNQSDESLEDVQVKASSVAHRRAAISGESLSCSSRCQAERFLEGPIGSRERKMYSSTQSASENPEPSLTDSKKSSVSWSSQQSQSFGSGKISPKLHTSFESKRSEDSDIIEPSRYSSKRSHDERSSVVSQESKCSGCSNSKRVFNDGLKIKVSQETIEEVSEKSEKSDDKSESEIMYKTERSFGPESGKKDQSKSFISVKISEETESEESEETDKSDKSIQYEKPKDLQKSAVPEYKEKHSKKSTSGVRQSKKIKSDVSDSKKKRKREILVEVTEESDGSITSVKSDPSKRSKGRLDKKSSPVLQLTKPDRDKSSSTSSILKTSSSSSKSDKSDAYTCTSNLETGISVCQCGDARIQTDCNCLGQIKTKQLEKVIPIQCPYLKPCIKTDAQGATGVCSRCKPEESAVEEHKQKKLCFDCYTSTSSSTVSDSNSKWRKNMCKAYTKGQVRYAITKITEYGQFTTFEIMKSTRKVPKFIPTTLEGVFVLKRKV
ncbi:serine-rich adhesin for platelets-like [Diabrotica virgifera virgifera]|uniref:Uncharacterized protein n=1 Tax=Diabrotica virgifera virgifera TaxID=50390 RepID=A0ABM5INE8_DIAVI|nr:serine-rich adhesin for platelets-like [Diabrotica virgifera virgifera]